MLNRSLILNSVAAFTVDNAACDNKLVAPFQLEDLSAFSLLQAGPIVHTIFVFIVAIVPRKFQIDCGKDYSRSPFSKAIPRGCPFRQCCPCP